MLFNASLETLLQKLGSPLIAELDPDDDPEDALWFTFKLCEPRDRPIVKDLIVFIYNFIEKCPHLPDIEFLKRAAAKYREIIGSGNPSNAFRVAFEIIGWSLIWDKPAIVRDPRFVQLLIVINDVTELIDRGIDIPFQLMDIALVMGSDRVFQALTETIGFTSPNAAVKAAASGNLTILKWLHKHKYKTHFVAALVPAAANGHNDVVQWIGSHYFIKKVMAKKKVNVTYYLKHALIKAVEHPDTFNIIQRAAQVFGVDTKTMKDSDYEILEKTIYAIISHRNSVAMNQLTQVLSTLPLIRTDNYRFNQFNDRTEDAVSAVLSELEKPFVEYDDLNDYDPIDDDELSDFYNHGCPIQKDGMDVFAMALIMAAKHGAAEMLPIIIKWFKTSLTEIKSFIKKSQFTTYFNIIYNLAICTAARFGHHVFVLEALVHGPKVTLATRNKKLPSPLDYAAAGCHLEIMKILINYYNITETTVKKAVVNNHINVINWILVKSGRVASAYIIKNLVYAAINGHLDFIQSIHSRICGDREVGDGSDIEFLKKSFINKLEQIILNKHLHVVKWLFEEGYINYNDLIQKKLFVIQCLDILKWVLSLNPLGYLQPHDLPIMIKMAIMRNNKDLIEWALSIYLDTIMEQTESDYYVFHAIESGNLELIALFQGLFPIYSCPSHITRGLVKKGDLATLKWINDRDDEIELIILYDDFKIAIKKGHYPIVRWMLEEFPELQESVDKDLFKMSLKEDINYDIIYCLLTYYQGNSKDLLSDPVIKLYLNDPDIYAWFADLVKMKAAGTA